MGQETILDFIDDDRQFIITKKWCMCGGCENFELDIIDLEYGDHVTIEAFTGIEFESGYEIANLASTVKALAEEIVILQKIIEEYEKDDQ